MKKLTFLLVALMVSSFAMQVNAQPAKAPMRSKIFNSLPGGFTQVGNTSIYVSVTAREAAGPGVQTGYSILGRIGTGSNTRYYSSTYESNGFLGLFPQAGAGFIAAFQVNGGTAHYFNAETGSTYDGVRMTSRIDAQGDVAAVITYTLTNINTDGDTVKVNAGVWGDIMIGNNDRAPLEQLKNTQDYVYGIKMKYENTPNTPLLCMLFGDGVTGVVSPADDYWFGHYLNNYSAAQMAGNYDTNISNYMQENGNYDCGLGFCWKDREIAPGESIELSFVISVGEIEYEEPFVPGDDRFEYDVEAYNIEAWNDLTVAHPAHVWGYYEHPYGQTGYIEYRVDGNRGDWTRIVTPLISGEEFDLPFDMYFNPDVTDIHRLELRFTDGLGNYSDMDGLQWEDVRSFGLTVAPEVQVYNGQPQIFVVTVGGVIDYTIGEDGKYTNPGTYSESIYGVYEMETIGIATVEFTVDKGQPDFTVIVPDDVEFDGKAHGATVNVVAGGDYTITYLNTVTGEVLTEAPVACGIYAVIVEMTENEFYYGKEATSYGTFEIYDTDTAVNEITVVNEDNAAWYTIDGRRVAAPTAPGLYIHNGKKYIVK